MALKFADRVKETTTTIGTAALALGGAQSGGFVAFSSVLSDQDTCYYTVQNAVLGEWETGLGTYNAGANTLTRTAVLASSNANAAVSLSAGVKDIWLDWPADRAGKAAYTDQANTFTLAAGVQSFLGGLSTGASAPLGLFGHSTSAQQTVTGTNLGNAALASFLTALANYGAIVDNTTYVLLKDSFIAPNGTTLATHPMDVGPGWTNLAGTEGNVTIQSGRAQLTASEVDVRVADCGKAEGTLTATLNASTIGANVFTGIILRCSDASNYLTLALYNTGFNIYDTVAGVQTQRATVAATWVPLTDYAFRFVASGNVLTGTYNGAHQISYTTSFNNTATKCGFRMVSDGANAQTLDNFLMTSP